MNAILSISYLIFTSKLAKPISKRCQRAGNINKKFDEAIDNETAYFAANKLISFIAINSLIIFCALKTCIRLRLFSIFNSRSFFIS